MISSARRFKRQLSLWPFRRRAFLEGESLIIVVLFIFVAAVNVAIVSPDWEYYVFCYDSLTLITTLDVCCTAVRVLLYNPARAKLNTSTSFCQMRGTPVSFGHTPGARHVYMMWF